MLILVWCYRQHFFRQQGPVTISNGSGFIIQSDGLIMTNAHVVVQQIPSDIRVRLTDGRTFTGHLESVDMQSDLATIRIKSVGIRSSSRKVWFGLPTTTTTKPTQFLHICVV